MAFAGLQNISNWRHSLLWSVSGILLLPALGCLLLIPLREAISSTDVAMLLLLWISAMALQFVFKKLRVNFL